MVKTSWFWLRLVGAIMMMVIFAIGLAQGTEQEIYIYVTLRQPECAGPPDSIEVSGVDCTDPNQYVDLKASRNPLGGEWFNVYRDTIPILWITSVDPSIKIGTTTSRDFTDDFSDGLWVPYGSKGVCDCDINYFYVMTTGDTMATGDTCESAYPSNCVGEFDFCLEDPVGLTNENHVVYTLVRSEIRDAASPNADEFCGTIGGANTVKSWNAGGQVWDVIAFYSPFPPPGGIVGSDDVELLYPYVIAGEGLDPIWSMQIPGLVPPDPHFNLIHNDLLTSWNHVSLPFYEQQIAIIETACDLYDDIGVTETIREWNAAGQVYNVIAFYSPFPPPGGCVGPSDVKAGYPYMVSVSANTTWPPTGDR